ncbi:MAG: glycosyltransferase family 39 protein [Candidatus Acidiferrales bacterium]
MTPPERSVRRTLFWMVAAALLLRLIVMCFVYGQQLNPDHGNWAFGFEEGRVAASIANGQGFSNPLYGPTGPTAWYGPVYPYILAGVFKLLGTYTKASCIAILSFNSLISALTCLPIFFLTRKGLGAGVAKVAGWIWVFFPDAVYGPNGRIWDTWLATLLLATLFFISLKLEDSTRVRDWAGFGLLSGVAALTSPVLLSVLPILALWMLYRLHRQQKRWLAPALSALLAVILVVSPWVVRNYRTFHRFIPIGDSLGLEIGIGNNGESWFPYSVTDGPWNPWKGDAQWKEFQRLGELGYFDKKSQEGAAYIRSHPSWYAGRVVRRIVYVWTNFWSLSERYRSTEALTPLTACLYAILSVLTLLGLCRAFRQYGIAVAMPYALVLFFFPLIYYFTHPAEWYRRPIDPFFVALAACEVFALASSKSPAFLVRTKVASERAS